MRRQQSVLSELIAQNTVPLEVDDRTTKRPCAIFRTRIHAHGPFEFRGVLRLVDMPMEPEDRLSFEDRGTKSRAADRNQDLLSSPHNRAWRGHWAVGPRCGVPPRS